MANATATLTLNAYPAGKDSTQQRAIRSGICALSASGTYQTNGVPVGNSSGQWSVMAAEGGSEFMDVINPVPILGSVFFCSNVGACTYLYVYDYVHYTLRIYSAPGTELGNGASITADTIGWIAEFSRF